MEGEICQVALKKPYNQKVQIYIFLGNTIINSLQMMITLILDG